MLVRVIGPVMQNGLLPLIITLLSGTWSSSGKRERKGERGREREKGREKKRRKKEEKKTI